MNTKLWYKTPAQLFVEALPIGNGSMGGMVYGGVPEEKIGLNLDTMWSGNKKKEISEIPEEYLQHARELIQQKKYYEAQCYMEQKMLGSYNESFMPFGDLYYSFLNFEGKEIKNYKRELDLENAIHKTVFEVDTVLYTSEVFISYPDQVMHIRLSASNPKSIAVKIRMDSILPHQTSAESDHIYLKGVTPTHVVPNYVSSDMPIVYDEANPGIKFGGFLNVESRDGKHYVKENHLYVEDATVVEMLLSIHDGFRGYDQPLNEDEMAIKENCFATVKAALKKGYDTLRSAHVKDHRRLFGRVKLELGEERADLPTDERLEEYKKSREDIGLEALFFQYGRYMLIASSRKGSQPANLQGIWGDSDRPVWSSNWTVNINTEMNYWPAGICNLTECYEPYIHMLEELSEAGKEAARKQFHCEGWTCNHNVDLWRQTTPVGGCAKYAYWPMGGVWLSLQLYEYYSYSQDKETLREKCFPIMKSAAEFCCDWMQLGEDGRYHTCPSTSPENSFVDEAGRECYVNDSSAMDLSIMRELFSCLLKMYDILGIPKDAFSKKISERMEQMAPICLTEEGLVAEWYFQEPYYDKGHRHFSPAIGIRTEEVFNEEMTPEIFNGIKKMVENRLESGSGHIGWSCAWLINLFSGFGDGEKANFYLEQLLSNSLYNNLFDLHPPLGEYEGEREVFQIDGNFGGTYGIATMLLNDKRGIMEFLPAIPDKWKKGAVTGLLARGGFECSIVWEKGAYQNAVITSKAGSVLKLKSEYPMIIRKDNTVLAQNVCYYEIKTKIGEEYNCSVKF